MKFRITQFKGAARTEEPSPSPTSLAWSYLVPGRSVPLVPKNDSIEEPLCSISPKALRPLPAASFLDQPRSQVGRSLVIQGFIALATSPGPGGAGRAPGP